MRQTNTHLRKQKQRHPHGAARTRHGGDPMAVGNGSLVAGALTPVEDLLNGVSYEEIDRRAGDLLNFEPDNPEEAEEDLFDFEVTDELRALAAGYEDLGDTIRQGHLPASLVLDLLYGEEGETEK